MRELRPGLWHWQSPHPDWSPDEPWDQSVSSYAIDDGDRLLLFDPLAPPSKIEELGAERETVIVLTAPWHERDARSLVERLGAPVYAPPPDTAQDLMQKFGITAEQAGDGSPDLVWLRAGDVGEWRPYGSGDRLPLGIEAFAGREHNDMVLWIESRRTVISGDTLVDFRNGLEINGWLRRDARAGGRGAPSTPRATSRACAPDARRAYRPRRPRARSRLTPRRRSRPPDDPTPPN